MDPALLTIHLREKLHTEGDEPRQIVEVREGERVLGQLPATRCVYELHPSRLGKLMVEFDVKRSQIETMP